MRDETDTGGFEWAEGDIGEEFGGGRRGEVDGGSVVGSGLVAELVDPLLLEKLISTELERALQEVACECWASTSEESTGTFVGDDFSEAANQAIVVCDGVELDSCLDAVKAALVLLPRNALNCCLDPHVQCRGYGVDLHIDGSEATVSN